MKRVLLSVALVGLLFVAGCTGDSDHAAFVDEGVVVANDDAGNLVSFKICNVPGGDPAASVVCPPGSAPGSLINIATFHTGGTPTQTAFLNLGGSNLAIFDANSGKGAIDEVGYHPDETFGAPWAGSPTATVGAGRGLAVTPNNAFAYGTGGGSINGFSINSTNETLTAVGGSPFAQGSPDTQAFALIDPSGSFLYVANEDSNTISAFTIGPAGSLTAILGSPFPTVGTCGPASLAINPAGTFLFIDCDDNSTIRVAPIKAGGGLGAQTAFGTAGTPESIVTDRTGSFLYVAEEFASAVETFSIGGGGALTSKSVIAIPPVGGSEGPEAVAVDGTNNFVYLLDQANGLLYSFSGAGAGALTAIPGSPFAGVGPGEFIEPGGLITTATIVTAIP